MSRIDEVRAQMMQAMKDRKKDRKDALSALLTALKNKAIDKREDLTAEEEDAVVLKEIKSVKETLEMTPADRTDIVEEFAPKMMNKEEILVVVQEVLAQIGIENPTPQEKGKIMKELMPRVKGKADGKLVNEVVAELLKK